MYVNAAHGNSSGGRHSLCILHKHVDAIKSFCSTVKSLSTEGAKEAQILENYSTEEGEYEEAR